MLTLRLGAQRETPPAQSAPAAPLAPVTGPRARGDPDQYHCPIQT